MGPRLLRATIRAYQLLLSPLFAGSCRFTPSCSAYALEAVAAHGVVRGGLLAARRVARCQPLCRGGYDPVPANSQRATPAAADTV